jgi:hypothetical protein
MPSSPIRPSDSKESILHQPNIEKNIVNPKGLLAAIREINTEKSVGFTLSKLNQGDNRLPLFCLFAQTMFYCVRTYMMASPGVPVLYKMANYFRLVVLIVESVYIYFLKHYTRPTYITLESKLLINIGNAVLIFHAIFAGLVVVSWCVTRDECFSDVCGQERPDKIIPLGMLLYQILGSITLPMCFTCHDAYASLLSVAITFSALIVGGIFLHLPPVDLVFLAAMGVTLCIVFIGHESFVWLNYTYIFRFECTLREKVASENKEYLMNIQTEEMRHMIGEPFFPAVCICRLHVLLFAYSLSPDFYNTLY